MKDKKEKDFSKGIYIIDENLYVPSYEVNNLFDIIEECIDEALKDYERIS